MGKGHKIPESIRQKVLEAVNAGIRYSDIARSFKIGQTSVRRIAKAAQKKSPEAPTAMENASEDTTASGSPADTNIITEVPENVKKEAPIETLSRAFNTLSEHIAQSFGSSAEEYSPYNSIVDEAVLERMENINFKIAQLKSEISVYEFELSKLEDYHLKYMEVQDYDYERNNENR